MDKVGDFYDKHVEDEDKRLDNNSLELPVTLSYIKRYLHAGEKVLDVACGTGRYALRLLDEGYLLGLNDLSKKNMDLTLQRIRQHPNVLYTDVSNALDSDIWAKTQWDAVLALGPLYHFQDKENRSQILKNSKEHTRSGGYIFLAFMTRMGALLYGLKHNPGGICKPDGVQQLWHTGTDASFVEGTEWFTHAYFSFPEEIEPLVREAGLRPLHLIAVDGIFGEHMELYHRMEPNLQRQWKQFIMETCEDPHMIHCSKHLLCICQNP